MSRERKAVAVVAGGGWGKRMGRALPKLFLPLAGQPILYRTLAALSRSPQIQSIVVALPARQFARWRRRFPIERRFPKVRRVIPGGATRVESVAKGLEAVGDAVELVLIHDGARPLVTPRMIAGVLKAAQRHGAAVIGVPVRPTIKHVGSRGDVRLTLDRSVLWEAQTPQAFRRELIVEAYQFARAHQWDATDDAQVAERFGIQVQMVPGSDTNIKITTPQDLAFAEWLIRQRKLTGGQ